MEKTKCEAYENGYARDIDSLDATITYCNIPECPYNHQKGFICKTSGLVEKVEEISLRA